MNTINSLPHGQALAIHSSIQLYFSCNSQYMHFKFPLASYSWHNSSYRPYPCHLQCHSPGVTCFSCNNCQPHPLITPMHPSIQSGDPSSYTPIWASSTTWSLSWQRRWRNSHCFQCPRGLGTAEAASPLQSDHPQQPYEEECYQAVRRV